MREVVPGIKVYKDNHLVWRNWNPIQPLEEDLLHKDLTSLFSTSNTLFNSLRQIGKRPKLPKMSVPTMNYQTSNTVEDEKDVKNVYEDEQVEAAHGHGRKGSVIAADYGQYINDAVDAVDGQKQQSIGQALRQYRKGVIFSIIFSS